MGGSRGASGVRDHRRDRERGRLVYPVRSRRSGGLSVGINPFPRAKRCGFDCPYCEVFPFPEGPEFSLGDLEAELVEFLDGGRREAWSGEPIRDLCVSGNGEPTMSPELGGILEICARLRSERPELLGGAEIVLITNSTGFSKPRLRELLGRFQAEHGLAIWAKLDGGTEEKLRRMSRSRYCLSDIVDGMRTFAAERRIVVQTMLCELEGEAPAEADALALASVLADLIRGGARLEGLQLYTKARPSPESTTSPLGDEEMAGLARVVARTLSEAGAALPIRVFGRDGELPPPPEGATR